LCHLIYVGVLMAILGTATVHRVNCAAYDRYRREVPALIPFAPPR
jgi:protein-S-isoprenylcysteine O-methyltransferase Ste14